MTNNKHTEKAARWIVLLLIVLCFTAGLEAQTPTDGEKQTRFFTIRMGQGGFTDDRSPINKLGGGQMTLDIKPTHWPVALSFFTEYYTNSPSPTHRYEISDLIALNILYINTHIHKRLTFFGGGGLGRLEVPKTEEDPEETITGLMANLECGINYRFVWKLGFYMMAKYLVAHKEIDGQKAIDFDEFIVMLGISVTFNL
ncbi:hypothetical protein KAR48_02815 [bacterium]|nr:hypothetical protein [bacterium]